MKELRFSNRFKKDFKRYRHDKEKLALLNEILHYLENGITIPMKFKPHMLHGDYNGCMECHIGPDFLLIWQDESENIVYIVRLGSHSELFD